jgi:hypothetical protein
MTTKNAIKIGKGIGKILELDNNSSRLISRQFIHFKIEINTSLPLASGFYMPYARSEPCWIAFKYKRLYKYCTYLVVLLVTRGSLSCSAKIDSSKQI